MKEPRHTSSDLLSSRNVAGSSQRDLICSLLYENQLMLWMCDSFLKKSVVMEKSLHLRIVKGRTSLAPPSFLFPSPVLPAEHCCGWVSTWTVFVQILRVLVFNYFFKEKQAQSSAWQGQFVNQEIHTLVLTTSAASPGVGIAGASSCFLCTTCTWIQRPEVRAVEAASLLVLEWSGRLCFCLNPF